MYWLPQLVQLLPEHISVTGWSLSVNVTLMGFSRKPGTMWFSFPVWILLYFGLTVSFWGLLDSSVSCPSCWECITASSWPLCQCHGGTGPPIGPETQIMSCGPRSTQVPNSPQGSRTFSIWSQKRFSEKKKWSQKRYLSFYCRNKYSGNRFLRLFT